MPPSALLHAFLRNTPLPKIITSLDLTADDLFDFLSTPGIPERLQALRALARFDHDQRQTAAQADAISYLHNLLKDPATDKVEGRRAATALLRGRPGCHGSSGPAASRAVGPARSDIADWLPPDHILDEQDDEESDAASLPLPAPAEKSARRSARTERGVPSLAPLSAGRNVRGFARTERGVPVSAESPRPIPLPAAVIPHQRPAEIPAMPAVIAGPTIPPFTVTTPIARQARLGFNPTLEQLPSSPNSAHPQTTAVAPITDDSG